MRVEGHVGDAVAADVEPLAFLVLRRQGIFHRIGRMDVVAHAVAVAVDHGPGDGVVVQAHHADGPIVVADHADEVADDLARSSYGAAPKRYCPPSPRGASETSWKRK